MLDYGGAEADGGGRTAASGLDDDVLRRQLGKLRPEVIRVARLGDDEDPLVRDKRSDAVHRGLNQGSLTEEGEKLLGTA
jgi:hypothetical protein